MLETEWCVHSFRVLGAGLALVYRALEAALLGAAGVAGRVVKATIDTLGGMDAGSFEGHPFVGAGSASKAMLGGGVLLSTYKATTAGRAFILQVAEGSAVHALFEGGANGSSPKVYFATKEVQGVVFEAIEEPLRRFPCCLLDDDVDVTYRKTVKLFVCRTPSWKGGQLYIGKIAGS